MKIGLIAFISALVIVDSQIASCEDDDNEISIKSSFGQAGKHLKQGFKDLTHRSGKAFKKLYCDSKIYFVQSGKTIKANSKQFAIKTKSNFKQAYGIKRKKNLPNINDIVDEANKNSMNLQSSGDCNLQQNKSIPLDQ